jgi:SPW repeat
MQMARPSVSDIRARLDYVVLALALLLFVSPWMLDFSGLAVATATAWISAAVIALLALAAIYRFAVWEEWFIMAMAVWLVVAPWALDFRYLNGAAAAFVGIGCFIFAIAISDIWAARRERRQSETGPVAH